MMICTHSVNLPPPRQTSPIKARAAIDNSTSPKYTS